MASQHKVLFITDSLGYPRTEPELVLYEETYIAILKRRFREIDFIHHGCGGATIVDLYKHSAYFHYALQPDLVFIQAGVVDCAPRALTVIEQQIISRLPIVSKPLGKLVKRNGALLRQLRKMTYTSPVAFERQVRAFEELFSNLYWIAILPVSLAYEQKVAGMAANVQRYNEILQSRKHVSTADFGTADTMSDLYHLSSAGHRKMADAIAERIDLELRGRSSLSHADTGGMKARSAAA